jgi:hypothetical protein
MDSDSDEKYDISGTEDEEIEPRPLSVAFYRQTMARSRFYHILHFCISWTITGWLTVMTYYGK